MNSAARTKPIHAMRTALTTRGLKGEYNCFFSEPFTAPFVPLTSLQAAIFHCIITHLMCYLSYSLPLFFAGYIRSCVFPLVPLCSASLAQCPPVRPQPLFTTIQLWPADRFIRVLLCATDLLC
jgi:hypothetical protein